MHASDSRGDGGFGTCLGRILVVLVLEDAEFGHGRLGSVAAAQLGAVQACGFDAHENPVWAWEGGFGVVVVEGETGGGWFGARGCQHGGGH